MRDYRKTHIRVSGYQTRKEGEEDTEFIERKDS